MPMNALVSIRAKFERFPAAVKGALLVRGADGQPHQIRLEGARVAELGGGQAHPVGIEAVVLEASPNQDTFVPFEISTMEMAAGWYRLECEVVVDGVPSVVHPGEPFAMPWPRAAVRRGTVTIGEKVAAVALESVECLGDVIRVPFASDERPAITLSVDGRPHPILDIEFDPEAGRGRVIGYPVLRADEQLMIEVAGETPWWSRSRNRVGGDPGRVAACGVGRSMSSIPRACAGCGEGAVAVLRRLCPRPPSAGAAVVPAMRASLHPAGALLSRLPAAAPRFGAGGLRRIDGPARRAIHRLKFSGWRDVAAALAGAMAAVGPPAASDVVTWVPLARGAAGRAWVRPGAGARRRAGARGSDAAGSATAAPRRGRPVPQARRSGAERRTAMRGRLPGRASRCRTGCCWSTTSSRPAPPLAAAAEALRAGGAHEVHALAAARSLPGRASLRAAGRSAYPRAGSRPGLWLPGDVPR